jgi:hypothetical protein
MLETRYRRGIIAAAATALLCGTLSPAFAISQPSEASPPPTPQPVATGDTLIDNYSFESGLAGWSSRSGTDADGARGVASCAGTASIATSHLRSGVQSAQLQSSKACLIPAIESTSALATAGTRYTTFATSDAKPGTAWVSLRFLDGSGKVVGAGRSTPRPGAGTLITSLIAPPTTSRVTVLLATTGHAYFDDALLSAEATDLGVQIAVGSSANGTAYSTDGAGHDLAYTVMTGAHGVNARLAGINLETTKLVLDLPIPGAMGAWNATSTADGTVYVGSYNYSDIAVGGRLYSYTPGGDHVVDLGAPVPGDTFVYGLSRGPDGSIIGGTYPSGAVWKYTPGTGFSAIGPRPILPGIQYLRSVAYDASTGIIYAGTAGTSHIVACPADGSAACIEVLPASYASVPWVYNMTAGDGHAFARVSDEHGYEHLVVIKGSKAADGTISASVVNDISGMSFPGATAPFEGKVYYAKSGALYSYDIASATETSLGVNSTIWARNWEVVHFADQVAYPGDTLVGSNAGGIVARYGIQSQKLVVGPVDRLPTGVADIETIQGGPDGKIYSAGYLIGGLGIYTPMRSDQQKQLSSGPGYGQAEGMTTMAGRIYQGVYPGGFIKSFTPADAASGVGPRTDCEIGQQQDRPYAMLGAAGKIYAGTMAIYGQVSGALTVLDTSTGQCVVHRDIVHNQSLVSLTAAKGLIVGGSLVWGALGVPSTEPEAKLLVLDPATAQSHTVDLPVRGLRAITALATAPDGKVWVLAQSYVMSFDPTTGQFSNVRNAFPDLVYGTGSEARISALDAQMVTAPDGQIYGAIHQRYLFRLDPRTGTTTILRKGTFQEIGLDGYGNVYTVYDVNHILRYVPLR